jgi:CAF1 family ribonuclease
LSKASFIAIDEEMTGISMPTKANLPNNSKPRRDESPPEQYKNKKLIAERYSIIQLGISLFEKRTSACNNDTNDASSNAVKTPPPIVTNNSRRGYAIQESNRHITASSSVKSGGPDTHSATYPKDWIIRKYNFYMFPDASSAREVLLNPGAIAFLRSHNMSLDTWSSQGVPYVFSDRATTNNNDDTIVQEAIRIIQNYINKTKLDMDEYWKTTPRGSNDNPVTALSTNRNDEPSVETTVKRTIELTRTADIAFYARVMASIREWLDNPLTPPVPNLDETQQQQQHHVEIDADQDPIQPEQQNHVVPNNNNLREARTPTSQALRATSSTSFLLPPCNSFLRRALYESIQLEYPTLITEKVTGYGNQHQIRILRLSEEEKYIRYLNLMKDRWNTFISCLLCNNFNSTWLSNTTPSSIICQDIS